MIGKDGEVITELPVSAGQPILLSICGYNRCVALYTFADGKHTHGI